jgi:pimeloyl-ACP methyl ester carboxylesterase
VSTPAAHPLRPHDRTGDGPVVAFIHGLEDTWSGWSPLAARLDPDWRPVALDMPWHAGNSYGWRRSDTSAGWLARGLDALDPPTDVLIGHSFGATAVLTLLATVARPVARAAVLVAPVYKPAHWPVSWALFERSRDLFVQVVDDGMRFRLAGRADAVDEEVYGLMLAKMVSRLGPMAFITLFEEFVASGGLPLHRIDVPVLVLGGGDDPTLSDGRAEALAAALPDATLVVEEPFHHMSHAAHTAEMAGHIAAFLATACPDLARLPSLRGVP